MIQALNDFVIIKRDKIEEKTKSGILLMTENEEPAKTGTVVSLGKLCKQLKKGDRVCLPFFAKDELSYNNEDYCYLHEKDIPAKI